MCAVIGRIIDNYVSNPTIVTTTGRDRSDVQVPQIAICPQSLLSLSALNKFINDGIEIQTGDEFAGILSQVVLDPEWNSAAFQFISTGGFSFVGDIRQFLLDIGIKCEDFFLSCRAPDLFPCCDNMKRIFTPGGICFVTTFNQTFTDVRRAQVFLEINTGHHFNDSVQKSFSFPGNAIMFSVAPQVNALELFNELPISGGYAYKMLLREERTQLENTMFTKSCDPTKPAGVSPTLCHELLKVHAQFSIRNCTSDLIGDDMDAVKLGSDAEKVTVLTNGRLHSNNAIFCPNEILRSGSLLTEEDTNSFLNAIGPCLPSCDYGQYSLTMSSVPRFHLESLFLEVRFATFVVDSYEETVQITCASVIGNVGGCMGVFIGASFLTIIEILRYLHSLFKCLIGRIQWRRRAEVEILGEEHEKSKSAGTAKGQPE